MIFVSRDREWSRREVEEVYFNIGFPLRIYQAYAWVIPIYLLPFLWQFTSMNFYGLVHIWIVGAPHHMIPPFSIFSM